MKRIFLSSILLITLLFVLTGCSNNDTTSQFNDKNDEVAIEELELNGTGEINLKDFIESFKLANKSWTEVSIEEAKLYYKVNENNETSTIPLANGDELWGYYSGKENGTTTIEEADGTSVTVYDEYISVKDLYGSSLSLRSEDIDVNKAAPAEVKVDHISFNILLDSPEMTEENKQEILEKSKIFSTIISENKCDSLETLLKAIGMETTDKTTLEAIEKELPYYAEYKSDLGNVEFDYNPGDNYIQFSFDDDNEYNSISIQEISNEGYKEIQIFIHKN